MAVVGRVHTALTILLQACTAIGALATGIDKTSHPSDVADLEARHGTAHLPHPANDFMAGHHWENRTSPFIAHLVKIAVANSTIENFKPNVILARLSAFKLKGLQWRADFGRGITVCLYHLFIMPLRPLACVLILATATLNAATRCAVQATAMERDIVEQMSLARRDPAAYAMRLENLIPSYKGSERELSTGVYLMTQEGLPAVEEAIAALKASPRRQTLAWDDCLSASAKAHVEDTGPKGLLGHTGSNGESMPARIRRFFPKFRRIGENISYGSNGAEAVVEDLLIDDGVANRGHRKNILEPHFNTAGAACGPHQQYGIVCVIDFAQR
jgi:uncharacterized protein YkwD